MLLQKTNQTATTKIDVKFDHGYVTARLDHLGLLFPAWPMNGELVSVRLYSLWDEKASRISVVFTAEGFVEVVYLASFALHALMHARLQLRLRHIARAELSLKLKPTSNRWMIQRCFEKAFHKNVHTAR